MLKNVDSIIDVNILKGVGIFGDIVIYVVFFRVGEVINGSLFSGVFFRNYVYRVILKIWKW